MPVQFEVEGIPYDVANPPVVPIFPDLSLPDGVSISDVRATVSTSAEVVSSLKGAVLRQSSVPPLRFPAYAKQAIPLGSSSGSYEFIFGKLSNATAGPDNKLVLWAVLAGGGNNVVAQLPFVGQFGAERLPVERAALAAQSNQTLLKTLSQVGLKNLSLENLWIIPDLGGIDITDPAEGNPTPPNRPITVAPGMQFATIQNVAGNFTGGSAISAWAVVLRAAAPIPQMPFGFPNPVQATITLGSIFFFSAVPGAVLGLDNKLVIWAQFLQQPALTIATRSFCGI